MDQITHYMAATIPDSLYALCLENCLERGHMRRDITSGRIEQSSSLHVLAIHQENTFCGWALVQTDSHGVYPFAQFFIISAFRRQGLAGKLMRDIVTRFGKVECCPNADTASAAFFARFEKDIHLSALSRAWIEKYALAPVSFSTSCAVRYVY